MKHITLILLLISLLQFNISCTQQAGTGDAGGGTGTGDTEEPAPTGNCSEDLSFAGVKSAEAYTHESIMVGWDTATGGCLAEGESYVYHISMDVVEGDQDQVVFITSETGITVTKLSNGTKYRFKVVAKDSKAEVGSVELDATTLVTSTPIFRGLTEILTYRPQTGKKREHNVAKFSWIEPAPSDAFGGNPAASYYKLFTATTFGGQLFNDECADLCTKDEWARKIPSCCKLEASSGFNTYEFKGLNPNNEIFSVIRACSSTHVCDENKNELYGKTGSHPSGMVKMDHPFIDADGKPYILYVDVVEAGCTNYDIDTQTCSDGAVANPPQPGLPPYVNITHGEAKALCGSQAIEGMGNSAVKRLITFKEFLIVSSWIKENPFDFTATGNALFGDAEQTDCNTSGLNTTLEGTGTGALLTGSNGTSACTSLKSSYTDAGSGPQDLIGNVWEWVDDTVTCLGSDSANGYCFGNANDIDDSILNFGYCNGDETGCSYDDTLGQNMLIINSNIIDVDEDLFASIVMSGSFFTGGSSNFNIPTEGASFNLDKFELSYESAVQYLNVGGAYSSHSPEDAGRFNTRADNSDTDAANDIGFRCVLSVPVELPSF
jgi:hypothetical protein